MFDQWQILMFHLEKLFDHRVEALQMPRSLWEREKHVYHKIGQRFGEFVASIGLIEDSLGCS